MATYTLTIERWTPVLKNRLLGNWRKRMRLKRADQPFLGWAMRTERVPPATGKRRVSLRAEGWGRGRLPDEDAFWLGLLDNLVFVGLLVDDGPAYCTLGAVEVVRAKAKRTTITLEDLP